MAIEKFGSVKPTGVHVDSISDSAVVGLGMGSKRPDLVPLDLQPRLGDE